MPATTVKSILAQKLGAKAAKAIANHKGDTRTVELSGGALPAGIENGVAKIVECGVQLIGPGKTNAGQPIFRAAAVIVSPHEHDGRKIEGRQTSMIIWLFDTPNRKEGSRTFDDHIGEVLAYMRSWGIDTDSIGDDAGAIETELCPLVLASDIHVSFRTWKGEKQTSGPYAGKEPRVNEQWGPAVAWEGDGSPATSDVQEEAPADAVDDNTTADANQDAVEEATDGPTHDELVALAKNADNAKSKTGVDSGRKLKELALEKGIDEADVDGAANWAAVVELIEGVGGEEVAAEDEASEEIVPAKDEVWQYTPIDAKTKKPAINPKTKKPLLVECEVQSVDKKTRTATLKNLDDQKTLYKGVAWDKLVAVS